MIALRRLVLPFLAALALAACAAPAPPPPTAPGAGSGGASPEASGIQRGGTLTMGVDVTFSGVDPHMGQQAYNVWPIAGERILRIDPATFKIEPGIVESWQYAPDGKTLTLKVRPGVKFHNKAPANGREVEAKDIVYNLHSITGQQYPQMSALRFPRRSNLEGMDKAEAVDKYTVKITFKKPSSGFLTGLAEYRSPVIPEGFREHFGADLNGLAAPSVDSILSAGPFVLTKFTNEVEAIYDANKEYWDKGQPYLDQVRQIWLPNQGTRVAALIAGQVDFLDRFGPEDAKLVKEQRKDIVALRYAPTGWRHFRFNVTKPPFDDIRVRKALFLAMDPIEVGETMSGKDVWKYPGPLTWGFPDALSQDELSRTPGLRRPKDQDIAEARRLLAEAGFANGLEVELITISGFSPSTGRAHAELFKFIWERNLPGVKINIKLQDTGIMQKTMADGNFTLVHYSFITDPTSVSNLIVSFHTKGGRNYGRFSDAKVDELLDKAAEELDDAKRKELLREVQYRVLDLVPAFSNEDLLSEALVHSWVKNMSFGPAANFQTMFRQVWVEKK